MKFQLDSFYSLKNMAKKKSGWMNRQTDEQADRGMDRHGESSIPQNFIWWGYKKCLLQAVPFFCHIVFKCSVVEEKSIFSWVVLC